MWLQAGKYVAALMSELPERNGWSIARHAGDRTPDKTQRLLNHASWDTLAAMSAVRRFAVTGLDGAARRNRRQGGMRIGALDETGQEKQGRSTAGVKRQYLGCAGRVANGINTVHLSYVREKTGHALIGARQWIPREHITDPVRSLATGLPAGLEFRTKGQLAIGICADAYADGISFDFICGDEVYGSCTQLRDFLEARGQAYVLRVASSFPVTLAGGTKLTCAEAVKRAAEGQAAVGGPLRRQGLQGPALVCLGLDRHRLPAALPAGPPPPEDRRAGLPLLLRARRAAADQGPADQGSRAALAGGRGFRARQGLLRPGPVPGPALHRDRRATSCWSWPPWRSAPSPPPCSADRTDTQAPPPSAPGQPPPARPGHDPADRPGDQAPARRRAPPPGPARAIAVHWLTPGAAATRPASRWFHQRARLNRDIRPGQLAKCGCRTRSTTTWGVHVESLRAMTLLNQRRASANSPVCMNHLAISCKASGWILVSTWRRRREACPYSPRSRAA